MTELLQVRAGARRLVEDARAALADGDGQRALEKVTEAWEVRHEPATARLAWAIAVAGGQWELAAAWRGVMEDAVA